MKRTSFLLLTMFLCFGFPGLFSPASDPAKPPAVKLSFSLVPIEPKAKDDQLRKLLIARYNEVLLEMKEAVRVHKTTGLGIPDALFSVSRRVLQAAVELGSDPAERVVLLTPVLEQVKNLEAVMEQMAKGNFPTDRSYLAPRFRSLRLEVEIQILQAKKIIPKGQ